MYDPNMPSIPQNTPNNQIDDSIDNPLTCENAESKTGTALAYENGVRPNGDNGWTHQLE